MLRYRWLPCVRHLRYRLERQMAAEASALTEGAAAQRLVSRPADRLVGAELLGNER